MFIYLSIKKFIYFKGENDIFDNGLCLNGITSYAFTFLGNKYFFIFFQMELLLMLLHSQELKFSFYKNVHFFQGIK